ncbi:MAG: ATP-dependent DNA helicase [Plesiomonas sp.]|uniref:ATP-dependent DNA helicase n=1 Tax=Plesiomonas sp. TaxID=2486279 RepID=UPI003F32688F
MIEKYFADNGALAQAINGFKAREPQRQMADAVASAIEQNTSLVVEAGTGTGKTYAYLVPALAAKRKTIISTGSKNLQDQLYSRDLPTIQHALNFTGKIALLKGRSNYVCLDRLDRQMAESHITDTGTLADLVRVRSWSSSSESGDLSDCDVVAEDSPVLPLITSTNESCLGTECPLYKECYVVKARRKALEADVVVVNHHLFLADMVVKETGFGELIPEAEVIIFDEAHQLPDIASQYFGQSLTSRQLLDLGKDMLLGYHIEVRDVAQLSKVADRLTQTAQDLCVVLCGGNARGNWRDMLRNPLVQGALARLNDALDFAADVLRLVVGRSKLLDAAFERAELFRARLKRLMDTDISGYSYWYECGSRHFSLNLTPLSVADKFSEQMKSHSAAWIFTSATLAVGDSFDHYCQRLGLGETRQMTLNSPFDYSQQALLCVPRFLPEANRPYTADRLVSLLTPVIEASRGRCFFLCTSHQMMRDLAERFRACLTLPVLVQGETGKQKLLQQFVEQGDALLVATGSFWEGVDVRGQALSCVIIDKLPFTAPDDPLLKARMEDNKLKGGEPFNDVQLPDAVITLKQGVGRLIRDTDDRGVIVICDPRLVAKPYGQTFLESLPPLPRTRDIARVIEFLHQISP